MSDFDAGEGEGDLTRDPEIWLAAIRVSIWASNPRFDQ